MSLALENFERQLQRLKELYPNTTISSFTPIPMSPLGVENKQIKPYKLSGQFRGLMRIAKTIWSPDLHLYPGVDDTRGIISMTLIRHDGYGMPVSSEDCKELHLITDPFDYKIESEGNRKRIHHDGDVAVDMEYDMWTFYLGENKKHINLIDSILVNFIGLPREKVRREPLETKLTTKSK